jgi:hypothetical protein
MLLGRYSLRLYEPALRIVLKGRHKQESPHKQEPSICLSAVDSIHRAAKSPLTRLRLVSKRRDAPVQGVYLGYDRRTPEVPVESGKRGEFLNSLSGWEQVALMSSENMVVVQGRVSTSMSSVSLFTRRPNPVARNTCSTPVAGSSVWLLCPHSMRAKN